jgi:hypothetical protein
MAQSKLTFTVAIAWWLPVYVRGVALMCSITGLEPDWGRVARTVRRAMRVKIQ